MSKKTLLRALALALCLLLTTASVLAEDAVQAAPIEEAIQEESEFSLVPEAPQTFDAAPEALPQDAAPAEPETDAPDAQAAEEVAPEAPAAQEVAPEAPAAQAPALETVAFSETHVIENDTWRNVNVTRAPGFTGPIARIEGQLTLDGALFDGVPARGADLPAWFTLGDTGRIVILDADFLMMDVSAFSFNKGSRQTLSLGVGGIAIPQKQAKWASSNSKVAKVSSRGVVKARRAGFAAITATMGDAVARCLVVVTDHKPVKSVKLSTRKLTLALNGGVQLGAAIRPADAHDQSLTWASSAPQIASVDQSGLVVGLSGGKATITATASNGKYGKCVVTVQEVKPTALGFVQPYITLNPGVQFAAQTRFTPEAVSNPAVSFASSDPTVAAVDASGLITAVGLGTATVTAVSAANPAVQARCRVSVREPGSQRMTGLIIGINPGHQTKTITQKYPLAPGSSRKAYGVKTGACGKWTRVNEYETTLAIGLKLAQLLTDEGATVVITRTSNDVMLTNIDRAKMLNDAGVDVALQLHCNSTSNSRAEGCSGYIRTTGDWVNESRAIAQCLTDAISASTGCVNLGVKIHNDYMSLNWTTTPSVLLEMGYLSNRKEDELLATDAYRQKMAEGIMEGLCAYFGR